MGQLCRRKSFGVEREEKGKNPQEKRKMWGIRRRSRNKRAREITEGSGEKGEEDGEAFPGKSSLPCHVSRKDSGVKVEGSGNTTPEHVPQRG